MNNAVYGKTMENIRKRIKVRIVKNEKDIIKYYLHILILKYMRKI